MRAAYYIVYYYYYGGGRLAALLCENGGNRYNVRMVVNRTRTTHRFRTGKHTWRIRYCNASEWKEVVNPSRRRCSVRTCSTRIVLVRAETCRTGVIERICDVLCYARLVAH